MPKDDKQMGMMFYPMMTLSGNFDTGLSHRMILTGDAKLLKCAEKGNALVLGVREKDAFAIPNERPAFMPGNHAPICPLKDLTDPKFSETLKAVQASREKETPPRQGKALAAAAAQISQAARSRNASLCGSRKESSRSPAMLALAP